MRKLIGPPHAHLDAPCTDACYEEEPAMTVDTPANTPGAYRMIRDDTGRLAAIQADPEMLTDGFHTMEELYDHRRALTAALAAVSAAALPNSAWRSKAHHPYDGPMFEGGYFIVGIVLPTGTITYHYKLAHWDDFSAVPELEHAPKWDGAPPSASVDRLLELAREMVS